MTIAIMQPYFLPYIGYFQLLNAVDTFVLYDDVSFINRGWVNRNNLLLGGKPYLFTIPLANASQNRLIHEVQISQDTAWGKKTLKTFQQAYQKAPEFQVVFPLLEEINFAPFFMVTNVVVKSAFFASTVPLENVRGLNLIPTFKVPIAPASNANSAPLFVDTAFHSPLNVIPLVAPTNFIVLVFCGVINVEVVAEESVPK